MLMKKSYVKSILTQIYPRQRNNLGFLYFAIQILSILKIFRVWMPTEHVNFFKVFQYFSVFRKLTLSFGRKIINSNFVSSSSFSERSKPWFWKILIAGMEIWVSTMENKFETT